MVRSIAISQPLLLAAVVAALGLALAVGLWLPGRAGAQAANTAERELSATEVMPGGRDNGNDYPHHRHWVDCGDPARRIRATWMGRPPTPGEHPMIRRTPLSKVSVSYSPWLGAGSFSYRVTASEHGGTTIPSRASVKVPRRRFAA